MENFLAWIINVGLIAFIIFVVVATVKHDVKYQGRLSTYQSECSERDGILIKGIYSKYHCIDGKSVLYTEY